MGTEATNTSGLEFVTEITDALNSARETGNMIKENRDELANKAAEVSNIAAKGKGVGRYCNWTVRST